MWIYFIKKYNLIFSIVLRLMYYLDIEMRAKNGEGLFVLSICSSLLLLQSTVKQIHTEPRLSKRDRGKDSERKLEGGH